MKNILSSSISKLILISMVTSMLALQSGCVSNPSSGGGEGMSNTQGGAIWGALAGAALGDATGKGKKGVLVGAALGAILGTTIGAYLDDREQKVMAAASQRAVQLPTNTRQHWESRDPNQNSKVTASGWVMPSTDIYERDDGRKCRDVKYVTTKDRQEHAEAGTLCDGKNGWVTAKFNFIGIPVFRS